MRSGQHEEMEESLRLKTVFAQVYLGVEAKEAVGSLQDFSGPFPG